MVLIIILLGCKVLVVQSYRKDFDLRYGLHKFLGLHLIRLEDYHFYHSGGSFDII